jgi:hypothetical protein
LIDRERQQPTLTVGCRRAKCLGNSVLMASSASTEHQGQAAEAIQFLLALNGSPDLLPTTIFLSSTCVAPLDQKVLYSACGQFVGQR